jgi:hypothetical protein
MDSTTRGSVLININCDGCMTSTTKRDKGVTKISRRVGKERVTKEVRDTLFVGRERASFC